MIHYRKQINNKLFGILKNNKKQFKLKNRKINKKIKSF